MSKKYPISVFIIAKNEADRIVHTLQSVVSWADEVIVIDSGSTDNTTEVAKALGAKVYFREWTGYGAQKRYGESLCQHRWLLNLDADEALDETLQQSIGRLFEKAEPACDAYKLKLVTVKPKNGRYMTLGPGNHYVRLYRKDKAEFRDSTIHDSVIFKDGVQGTIGVIKPGVILHRCFRSYNHMIEKINFYSTMQAADYVKKGRTLSPIRIALEPVFAFIKAYIFRRYFLWGVDGIIEAWLYAFARTARLAKIQELSCQPNPDKK